MAEKDKISELPADIIDIILGFLPIQEAARTAILSSFWKDVWFSLTKLKFGCGFFDYLCLKYSDAEGVKIAPIFEVINKILMRHNGPIQKIVFNFFGELFALLPAEFDDEDIANLLEDNLNQWFLLLTQNGVEEIDISCCIDIEERCRVPNCIFSCPTLKRLILFNVSVELIDASCVLPNVTSLCLDLVNFKPRNCSDYVVYLPMLEDLSFVECDDIFHFNIVAPKLGSLKIFLPYCSCYDYKEFGVLPPNLDLRSISSLVLSCSTCCFEMFIEELTRVGNAPALNIELLKLHISKCSFSPDNMNNSAFIHLLRACPKLCELDMWGLEPRPPPCLPLPLTFPFSFHRFPVPVEDGSTLAASEAPAAIDGCRGGVLQQQASGISLSSRSNGVSSSRRLSSMACGLCRSVGSGDSMRSPHLRDVVMAVTTTELINGVVDPGSGKQSSW
nr:F-box/FBD/LRR-repeat protein At1g13570-like [Ipomoea batatas]